MLTVSCRRIIRSGRVVADMHLLSLFLNNLGLYLEMQMCLALNIDCILRLETETSVLVGGRSDFLLIFLVMLIACLVLTLGIS